MSIFIYEVVLFKFNRKAYKDEYSLVSPKTQTKS